MPDDDSDERFHHIRGNVLKQFEFVDRAQPDLLVITGDLSMKDYSKTACQWIKEHLPEVPTIVIPGNHDDQNLVASLFGQWPDQQFYDDCALSFLDTSSDSLPTGSLKRLEKTRSDKPGLLFIHHPPHLIGSGYMSLNQPLNNHLAVAKAISDSDIQYVFCGHFHNRAEVKCKNFELYLAPSPAFEVSLEHSEFTMESFQPAVRTIEVSMGKLTTYISYL